MWEGTESNSAALQWCREEKSARGARAADVAERAPQRPGGPMQLTSKYPYPAAPLSLFPPLAPPPFLPAHPFASLGGCVPHPFSSRFMAPKVLYAATGRDIVSNVLKRQTLPHASYHCPPLTRPAPPPRASHHHPSVLLSYECHSQTLHLPQCAVPVLFASFLPCPSLPSPS